MVANDGIHQLVHELVRIESELLHRPVRVAAAGVQVRNGVILRGLGGDLGEKVLDFERAQLFVLFEFDIVHGISPFGFSSRKRATYDSSMMTTMPQMVSSVLPTA